ncbi:MAG: hypothetical protein QXL96_04230 [Ignisphaera sp.]
MKNLCAHADTLNNICVEQCCISLEDFSQIVDTVAKVIKAVEMSSECSLDIRVYNRLLMLKNLAINTLGKVISLINTIKRCKLNQNTDVIINTLCNLANGIVEIRNIIKEILDESSTITCYTIKTNFENLVRFINYIGLKTFILMLILLNNFDYIPATLSGKIASSFASLLFASLLSIHDVRVKEALKECAYVIK